MIRKNYLIASILISIDLLILSLEICLGYLVYKQSDTDAIFKIKDYLPMECMIIFCLILMIAIGIGFITGKGKVY